MIYILLHKNLSYMFLSNYFKQDTPLPLCVIVEIKLVYREYLKMRQYLCFMFLQRILFVIIAPIHVQLHEEKNKNMVVNMKTNIMFNVILI